MKTKIVFSLLFAFLLVSCGTASKNSDKEKNGFILIEENKTKGDKTLPLSELIDDYRIVKFENSDSAIFRAWKTALSKNYVAIIQGGSQPVVLFDKTGKFLGNIGQIGQGPGEYIMAYDALIDEKRNKIYIVELNSNHILGYDLEGNYLSTKEVGNLNKPSLFLNDDGTVSVVSITFGDTDEPFTAAIVGDTVINKITYPYLVTNLRDQSGVVNGFDNEVWSYRNTANNSFMMTYNDTLYSFNPAETAISPRAFLKEKSQKEPNSWYVGIELPDAIAYNVIGPDGRTIWYDKETGEISKINIINDYLGNASISTGNFRDGYFVQVWEPAQLIDKIEEKWLPNNEMTDQQKEDLNKFLSELDPDGNNIMFLGRLKKNNY